MKILNHLFYDQPYLKQIGKPELFKIAIDIGLASGKWLEVTGATDDGIQFAEVSSDKFREKTTTYVEKSGSEHGMQHKEILIAIVWEMTCTARYDFEKEVLMLAKAYWELNPADDQVLKEARFMREELELARTITTAVNKENGDEDARSQETIINPGESGKRTPLVKAQPISTISDHLDNKQDNNQVNADATDNLAPKKVETINEDGNKPQTSKQANNRVDGEVGGGYRPPHSRNQTSADSGLNPQRLSWAQQMDEEDQFRQAQQRFVQAQQQFRNLTITANTGSGVPRIQQAGLGTYTNPAMRVGQYQPDLTTSPGTEAPMYRNRSNPFDILEKFGGDRIELVDEWVYKVENLIQLQHIRSEDVIPLLTHKLTGNAFQTAVRLSKESGGRVEWETFKDEFCAYCDTNDYQFELRNQLTQITYDKCGRNYPNFITKFKSIINRLSGVSQDEILFHFKRALPKELKLKIVDDSKSKTLKGAIVLASRHASYTEVNEIFQANTAKPVWQNNSKYNKDRKNGQRHWAQHKYQNYKNQTGTNNGAYKNNQGNWAKTSQNNWNKTSQNNWNNRKQNKGKPDDKKKPGRFQFKTNKRTNYKANTARLDDDQIGEEDDQVVIIAKVLTSKTSKKKDVLCAKTKVADLDIQSVIDSGATASIMSYNTVRKYGLEIQASTARIKSQNNAIESVKGVTRYLKVVVGGSECMIRFFITDNEDYDAILGLDWFYKTDAMLHPRGRVIHLPNGTVPVFEPRATRRHSQDDSDEDDILLTDVLADEDESLDALTHFEEVTEIKIIPEEKLSPNQVKQFRDLFQGKLDVFAKKISDLKTCKIGSHQIRTTEGPPVYTPAYRVSMAERETLKKEIQKMLEADVIEQSNSAWSSPVVLIPKKDGSKRFCVDYRKLNAITITENWPVPRIQDILDRLGESTWFTTVDLASGYWQVSIDPNSRQKTAFSTPDGHYQFKKMPFGLKNAPTAFNRIIQQILGRLPFVELYFDDIGIHSKSFELHISHVFEALSIIQKAGLKLQGTKCKWFCKRAKVLGHVVSKGKVEMDSDKIEALKQRKPPTNVKQVQQFLGICNYYRRFVCDFSKIAVPLNDLLKSETPFKWGPDEQTAFDRLIEALTSYPVLRQPDFGKQFVLHTDASGYALGAILSQRDDENKEYTCAYASRTLRGAEKNYGITEKECLAVVWAIKQFRIYLTGTKFEVVTDHSALIWLMNISDPTGRLARWAIYLQAYEFKITHRKGSIHSNADALSSPVLLGTVISEVNEDDYHSPKSLDPYDDEALLNFLRFKIHLSGTTVKQMKRIEKLRKLYRLTINDLGKEVIVYTKDNESQPLIIPEKSERTGIALRAHLLGHFQTESTMRRIQERFFWKNMRHTVEMVIRACTECVRHQKTPVVNHGARVLEISGIFERIGIDLQFGFPESQEGFKGLLVIVEYLTKYVVAYPIKSKTAPEVAEKLMDYIATFGAPKVILSDQGTEFNNKIVDALIRGAGAEHRVTSAYHPRTNGLTERMNATIATAIRKHAAGDHVNWPKWVPFVLLAYRSRIHSSTGYTPFELMFGRRMNGFELDNSTSNQDESEDLWSRANEIRCLVDGVQPKAIENIKKSQVTQVKSQNKAHQVDNTRLEIGSQVYVMVKGIQDKLQDKFKGPFTIVEHAKGGNFRLKNVLNQTLNGSFPRERLKPARNVDNNKYYRIEKILDDKIDKDGKREFYVKWKDQELGAPSWEPQENFADLDIINKYLKEKQKTQKQAIQEPNPGQTSSLERAPTIKRWVKKPNIAQEQPKSTQNTVKKRGRPRKINLLTMLTAILLFWVVPVIAGVKGSFHFCSVVNRIARITPVVDIYQSCLSWTDTEAATKLIEGLNLSKPIFVLAKAPYKVNGFGIECQKKAFKIRTYMNIIRGRSIDAEEVSHIKVNKDECEYMYRTKKCETNTMTCNEGRCEFDGKPIPEYHYLSTFEQIGVSCVVERKHIMAKDDQEELFSTGCKASDLQCVLSNSIIVWSKDIIRNCPLDLVTKVSNLTSVTKDVVFHAENKWAFQLLKEELICSSEFTNGIKVIKTTEGLLLTSDRRATKLKRIDLNLASIHELILSEEDGFKVAEVSHYRQLRQRLCEQNMRFLRLLAQHDDTFATIQAKDVNTVVYVKNGNIVLPKCANVNEIELVEINGECYKDLQVRYTLSNKKAKGFLTQSGIIRIDSIKIPCTSSNRFIPVPNSESIIGFNDKEAWIETIANKIKIEELSDTGPKYNFPHYQEIVEELDILQAIHWQETVREKKESIDKHWKIHTAKVTFTSMEIFDWIKSALDWSRTLWISLAVISLSIVTTIIIYRVCQRRRKRERRKQVEEQLRRIPRIE